MINAVTLVGNLGADPEPKYFESGSQVTRFTLYMNERYGKNGQTQERTHRVPVEVWGQPAEFVNNYIRKGNKVAVQGSLVEDTWKDGEQKKSRLIVKAQRVENLTPKQADPTSGYDDDSEF